MRLWQCCGADAKTGSVSCGNPTDERFDAPGPNFIKTYWPRQNEKKENDIGAIVGGIIAAVVVLLVLLIAILLLRRSRHRNQEGRKVASDFESLNSRPRFGAGYSAKIWKLSPVELQDSTTPIEMEGQDQRETIELPGTIPQREVGVLPYGVLDSRM